MGNKARQSSRWPLEGNGDKIHRTKNSPFYPFQGVRVVVLSVVTMLSSHHHYLMPEPFHSPESNPAVTLSRPSPPPIQGSLWICLSWTLCTRAIIQ